MPERPTLLIVAGESSGELYGALLAREIKKNFPDARVAGIGGERMREAGVEVFGRITGAFGLAVSALWELRRNFKLLMRKADELRPSLAVLIDFPDFNFRAGAALRKKGVKILYYVSPQVWAWRAGRLNKMACFVDRAALILPFEGELYARAGIPSEFVGHPALDEIRLQGYDRTAVGGGPPSIAILPGSRKSELARHLPILIRAAALLRGEFPEYRFVLPLAPNLDITPFGYELENLRSLGTDIIMGDAIGALARSRAAAIASGTAALQAAFLGVPFCVFYRMNPLTFAIGRALVRVKFISLVNILRDRAVARELLQREATPENIVAELRKFLREPAERHKMVSELEEVRKIFSGMSASARTARIAAELAGWDF